MSEPESSELVRVDCECAADCGEDVLVTIEEYAAAHQEADYVLVRPGHPVDAGERGSHVVTEADRYAVIAEGWALTENEVPPASLLGRTDHYLRTLNRRIVVSPDRLLLSGSNSVFVMPGAEKRTLSPSSTGST